MNFFFLQDLRNQLYESYYLNFISAISRSKLEDIASAALASNAVNQVTKVGQALKLEKLFAWSFEMFVKN